MSSYTFGDFVRGRRLGYYPLEGVGFVRISEGVGDTFVVEVVPFGVRIPTGRHLHRGESEVGYYCWWESGGVEHIGRRTRAAWRRHGRPSRMVLDYDGGFIAT